MKQYQIEISNRFVALENASNSKDINRTCESIKQNIKISAKKSLDLGELQQQIPWFDEAFLGFL